MFLCSCCTTVSGREVEKAQEIVLEGLEPQSFAAQPTGFELEGHWDAFTCKVRREDGEWGMLCDSWGDCIQIVRVNGGKVGEYNDSVNTALKLTRGDIILQVDGKNVHPESLRQLKHAPKADFKVKRLVPSKVKVTKAESQLWGMKMSYQKGRSLCLRVTAVNDGAMKEYNQAVDAGSQIKPSDFIVSVNGCQGDPKKMLEVFRNSSDIDLTIMRLP